MSHSNQKWVIVVLIYADFRKNINGFNTTTAFEMSEQMKTTLNALFKDLLTTSLDPKRGRMFVLMNSIDYLEEDSTTISAKTLLYRIDNEDNLDTNRIVSCKVIESSPGTPAEPNPKNPFQKVEVLKCILKKEITIEQDEEVFFITWDHGSAFGIFREVDAGVPAIRLPIDHDLDRYPYLAHFWKFALNANENKDSKRKFKDLFDNSESFSPSLVQMNHTLYAVKPTFNEDAVPRITLKSTRDRKQENAVAETLQRQHEVNAFRLGRTIKMLNTENVREILSNDELAHILTGWLNDDKSDSPKKVGVLLMMNCWMMNLHTMFSLKDAVECLVAPQGAIDAPGYNYKAILKYLFGEKQKFITPQQLAIVCVTTSESKRMRRRSKKLRSDGKDMIDQWKIFAVDLQRKREDGELILKFHLDRIMDIINKLNSIPESDKLRQFYTATRMASHDFTKSSSLEEPGFMIDIINWLSLLYKLSAFNPSYQPFPVLNKYKILADISKLLEIFGTDSDTNQLILAATSGKEIYNTMAVVSFQPTGYSIFFPNSLSTNQNLIDNVKKDSLLAKSEVWKNFIKSTYPQKIWGPFFE